MKKTVKFFVGASVLLSGFIILNPITVCLMGLIAPKWLASKFFDENQSKNLLIKGFFIPLQWQHWIYKFLLPWSKRKVFIAKDLSVASKRNRIRYALDEPGCFKYLKQKEQEIAFSKADQNQQISWGKELLSSSNTNAISEEILKAICQLPQENIQDIFSDKSILFNQFKIMLDYPLDFYELFKGTVPDKFILEMAKKPMHKKSLCKILKKQGIGNSSIEELLQISKEDIEVLDALKVRRQKNLMAQGCKDIEIFKSLCAEGLCIEAQKKMKFWQYAIFHHMGGNLSSEALLHFLQTQNNEISRHIIDYEEPALQDEFVQQMIFGSDKLFLFYKEIKTTQSTKKAGV